MEGIDKWGLAIGIFFLLGGLILLIYSFSSKFLIVQAFVLIVLGLVILLTLKKQEEIELIKKAKKIKSKKIIK